MTRRRGKLPGRLLPITTPDKGSFLPFVAIRHPSVAPPWSIMKLWPCRRWLVQCPFLLRRLRRIGQGHVRLDCPDCVPGYVQDQEILDPVFLLDFRTWKKVGGNRRILGRGTRRRSTCG